MVLLDLIELGGWVSVAILGAYIVGLVVTCERFLYLFQTRGNTDYFFEQVQLWHPSHGENKHNTQQLQSMRYQNSSYYALLNVMIENHASTDILDKQLSQVARSNVQSMESSLWILPLIAQIAPLAGLLGTMTGLIQSFKVMHANTSGVNMSFLAGGIWEAMITTVLGMTVAILTLIAHRWLDRIVDKRANALESLMTHIIIRHTTCASH